MFNDSLTQLPASLLGLLFNPEDGGDVPPKRRLTFIRLHGVISPENRTLKVKQEL
jgi:hypothetical protein